MQHKGGKGARALFAGADAAQRHLQRDAGRVLQAVARRKMCYACGRSSDTCSDSCEHTTARCTVLSRQPRGSKPACHRSTFTSQQSVNKPPSKHTLRPTTFRQGIEMRGSSGRQSSAVWSAMSCASAFGSAGQRRQHGSSGSWGGAWVAALPRQCCQGKVLPSATKRYQVLPRQCCFRQASVARPAVWGSTAAAGGSCPPCLPAASPAPAPG